jgi:hypothetical protein
MLVQLPVIWEDWSEEERAELDRLAASFQDERYDIEFGKTDEMDPWWIVHDAQSEGVVIHIARAGRWYLVWLGSGRPVRSRGLKAAVDLIISNKASSAGA